MHATPIFVPLLAHMSAVTVLTVLTGGSPPANVGIIRRVKHGQVVEARIFTSFGLLA